MEKINTLIKFILLGKIKPQNKNQDIKWWLNSNTPQMWLHMLSDYLLCEKTLLRYKGFML